MGVVNVDWGSMESNSFEPLEPGDYAGTIDKITEKGPGASGYKYLEVEIAIPVEGQEKPRRQWTNYSFSPKALWKMKEDFEALGLDVSSGTFDTDELIGRDVVVTLGLRDKYNAQPDENGEMPQENEVTALAPGGF
jgi:hypothetical protein